MADGNGSRRVIAEEKVIAEGVRSIAKVHGKAIGVMGEDVSLSYVDEGGGAMAILVRVSDRMDELTRVIRLSPYDVHALMEAVHDVHNAHMMEHGTDRKVDEFDMRFAYVEGILSVKADRTRIVIESKEEEKEEKKEKEEE